MLADVTSTAADGLASQGPIGIVALLAISALVVLWRRDVSRSAAEITRLEKALDREALARADAEKARADLELYVREKVVVAVTDVARLGIGFNDILRQSLQSPNTSGLRERRRDT